MFFVDALPTCFVILFFVTLVKFIKKGYFLIVEKLEKLRYVLVHLTQRNM
jgi:hypothetical protein